MSQMVKQAIAHYDELLETYAPKLQAIQEQFLDDCLKNKLTFGDRPVFNFLRPNFLSTSQYDEIQIVCLHLRNAISKFKQAAFADPDTMEQAGILEGERFLVDIDPGFDRLSITARWDSFMQSDDTLKFVELNAESPAGIAYSDVASQVYRRLPFVREFMKRYSVLDWNVRKTLLKELLATYTVYRGNKRRPKPNIAIVDWRDVPTYTEFQLFQEFFQSEGYNCVIADPRDLSYKNSRLSLGDYEIDLVYKRILTNDCVEKPLETKALVQACRDHNVCLVNPFRAKIVHKKSVFAVLTHEKNRHLFSGQELSVILKHIPWTRMIFREFTTFKGRRIDLVDYVSANKNQFVIKPNDEYGGKGVTLGMETSQDDWQKVIREAIDGEPYVVQEKVEFPRVSFPLYENGTLHYREMVVDLDPYVFGHRVDGVLTRLSASSLANVTAGGGTAPTFVINLIHEREESSGSVLSATRKTRKFSTTKHLKAKSRKMMNSKRSVTKKRKTSPTKKTVQNVVHGKKAGRNKLTTKRQNVSRTKKKVQKTAHRK